MLRFFVNELSDYQPRRLGIRIQNRTTFSEIAETVVWLTTGMWRPIGAGAVQDASMLVLLTLWSLRERWMLRAVLHT